MKSDFDLTIVTVTYNAMGVIERCISSVQGIYGCKELSVEHLIIDGVSTDGTVNYLQTQLEQGRITRYISAPDKGIYDAMNKGIWEARGKVVAFINADDELCPEDVPACCKPILNGEAEYVYASAAVRDENGKARPLLSPMLDSCFIDLPCNHQAMFTSADLLRRMGGFRQDDFKVAADVDLMRRIHSANIPPVVVDAVPCVFYLGGVSSSVTVAEEWIRLFMEFRERMIRQIAANPELAETLLNALLFNLSMIAIEKQNIRVRELHAAQWVAGLVSDVRNIVPTALCERLQKRLQQRYRKYMFRAMYKWRKRKKLVTQARVCLYLFDLLSV